MKSHNIRIVFATLVSCAIAFLISLSSASAETLDTLVEYGNGAQGPIPNPAGNSRGADFSGAATNTYVITATGSDIWGNSDHGSFIYDADVTRAAGSNFSAVVRSVTIAADPLEQLAGQWGRTGVMARDTLDANSPNVAHIRKTNTGGAGHTVLQGRKNAGQGTDRGPGNNGQFTNGAQNNANGSVRNTPIWLAIHRVDGKWYGTWASDDNGSPGAWSAPKERLDNAGNNMNGDVHVGLAHQAHSNNNARGSGGNTAVFDNFSVSDFGTFSSGGSGTLVLDGTNVILNTDAFKLGNDPAATEWRVDHISSGAAVINSIGITAFHQGDSLNGNGSTLRAIDGSGMTKGDANDPSTWTVSSTAWADDWQGFSSDNTGDNTWVVIELDGSTADLDQMYLWNVAEGNALNRGVNGFDIYFSDNPTLTPPAASGAVTPYSFASGGWTQLSTGNTLAQGTQVGDAGQSFDVSGAAGAKYIGLHITSNHGGPRTGLAEIAFATASTEATQGGTGVVANLTLDNPVTAATTSVKLYADGSLVTTLNLAPLVTSSSFTGYKEVTVVIADGVTSATDEATITATDSAGNALASTATRDGSNVTVVITVGDVEPLSSVTVNLAGATTAGGSLSYSPSQGAYPFYEEMRAGLSAPTNSTTGWDVMEWTGKTGYVGGLNAIRNDAPTATATVPFINFTDPESNATAGDWNVDDRPIITNTPANDNNYVTFARTTWTATAGNYTIRVRSDDGYGLRINGGATVAAVKGAAQNTAGADGASSYFTAGTGNSNAYIQIVIPTDGDYVVEFFSFEGGGGSNQEILINTGHKQNLNANFWELFGDMSEYNPASRWGDIPSSVLPYLAQEGTDEAGWHAKIWYQARNGSNQDVGNLDQTMRFIRDIDAGTSTYNGLFDGFLGSLNHSPTGGNAGRINPTEAYPDPTDGGAKSNDRIAMLAHARLVIPADGDYTVQVRSDDGFLMRFLDPANTFHSENGNGKIEMLYPSEITHQNGTGDSNTRAAAYLTAGTHDIAFVWWEGGGGDHFEVSFIPGRKMNQNAAFVLLDTSFLGKGPSLDNDLDGLSDPWEIANFGNLDQDGTGDADSDGLTDAQEFAAGSNPNSTDSDGDGLLDAAEVAAGTDPANSDSDGDGLKDGAEIANGSDPLVADIALHPNLLLYMDFEGGAPVDKSLYQRDLTHHMSRYPGGEAPAKAIDGNYGSKYLNFSKYGIGLIVTPAGGASVAEKLELSTANDAEGRDPSSYVVSGTNDAISSAENGHGASENWTEISSGALALPAGRSVQKAQTVTFANATAYTSYKIVFGTIKNDGDNSMQIAEVQLLTGADAAIISAGDAVVGIGGGPSGAAGPAAGASPASALRLGGGVIKTDIHTHTHLESYTMVAWVKPKAASLSGDRFFFGQQTQGIHSGLRGNGRPHQAHWGADDYGSTILTADEWAHLAFTYDGKQDNDGNTGTGIIYLNGSEDGTKADSKKRPNQGNNLQVGGRHGQQNGNTGESWFIGDIDDVAVWNKVLTPEEITALAAGQSPLGADIPLLITNIVTTGTTANVESIAFTFSNTPGTKYKVERSSDLLIWEELDDDV
ncbi:MAG: LamG-like jellyroll fold domain-containing protein, partial [Verrucomicrobiales bacterium]